MEWEKVTGKTLVRKNIFSFEFLRETLPPKNIENADSPYISKMKKWTNEYYHHLQIDDFPLSTQLGIRLFSAFCGS